MVSLVSPAGIFRGQAKNSPLELWEFNTACAQLRSGQGHVASFPSGDFPGRTGVRPGRTATEEVLGPCLEGGESGSFSLHSFGSEKPFRCPDGRG